MTSKSPSGDDPGTSNKEAVRLKRGGDLTPYCAELAARDAMLADVYAVVGAPAVRRRRRGFEGLLRIIVEQQVSVASAKAIWGRVEDRFGAPCPETTRAAGLDGLRALGLSRPKARYALALSEDVLTGALDFAAIRKMDDERAAEALIAVTGVGPWSAAIYLLFCEGRADIWPPSDIALRNAYNAAAALGSEKDNPESLDQNGVDSLAAEWSPWRAAAAHLLWAYWRHLRA